MSARPTGTVTFLFTDIEGSTKLWEQHPTAMKAAVARHDAALRRAVEEQQGYVVKTTGDGLLAAFSTAHDALAAALVAQRAVLAETWSEIGSLRVRMGLHTGPAEERDGDYFGSALNRAARLMGVGHGGQVLLSLPTYELVRDHLPDGVTLRDLGAQRLKDLARPEHVYQLMAPDLPADFPPLKTLDNRPNNLPVQRDPLIGREKEVATVRAMLLRPDVGLVTLTGPGGTGKTRLALQVAADLLDQFTDGVYFVDLAPITDEGLVSSAIAQPLGVREQGGRPVLDLLKDYLRDKHLLLVLDNFEQITDAAPLVSDLLLAASKIKVLVTSRAVLHLRGEHEFPVPPLAVPDPKRLPVGAANLAPALSQFDSVRLFIERATAVKPDFAVTNENAPAVAEICYRLDGLPLAIELAAARIKLFPPLALVQRLGASLKLLTGGARDLPTRQQTLRNAIAWSYDLLSKPEQALFQRMGVFVGGATLEAIEAVCNAERDLQIDVLDGVAELVDRSLLRQDEAAGDELRFSMLETIREYALEQLSADTETDRLRQAHARFFLDLAEQWEPGLHDQNQSARFEQFETEHDNVRAALRWAVESSGDAELGLRLVAALTWFWYIRGYGSEGRRWIQRALSVRGAERHNEVRAKALFSAGVLAEKQSDHVAQRAHLRESSTLAREAGDKRVLAYALTFRGVAPREPNQVLLVQEGLTLFRNSGDKWGLALGLYELGRLHFADADYPLARALFAESLSAFRELGDKWAMTLALGGLGDTARNQHDTRAAHAYYEESLGLQRVLGDAMGVAWSLWALGELACLQADYRRAVEAYHESVELYRELGNRRGVSYSLYGLAKVALAEGDYKRTCSLIQESLTLWKDLGYMGDIATGLRRLAEVAVQQQRFERAARLLGAADAIRGDSNLTRPSAGTLGQASILITEAIQLGENQFGAAWAEGRTMTLEQAVAYALAEAPGAG